MTDDISKVLAKKFVALAEEKNELIDKYELLVKKHDEMVPHINSARITATQGGKFSNPRLNKTVESMVRYDSGNEDFTMDLFKEWENDISEMNKKLSQLTFALSTLREIRDSQKTETEKN
jgi:hypothetical protein